MPKTAGTSLANALCKAGAIRTAACAELVDSCMPRSSVNSPNHLPARDLRSYFGEPEWSRRFTFGFVRNPWDRLVSKYTFIQNKSNHRQHATVATQSFEQFVHEIAGQRGPDFWFDDEKGNQIVDRIYRFETLADDFPDILRRCGVKADIALPHVNSSPRERYRSYYDEDLTSLVARRCADEIKRFDYSF